MITYQELEALGKDALPIMEFPDPPHERDGKDDWGSDRQIEAQSLFFEEVQKILSPEDFAALEAYCLKAGPEEMVAEGLRIAKKTLLGSPADG